MGKQRTLWPGLLLLIVQGTIIQNSFSQVVPVNKDSAANGRFFIRCVPSRLNAVPLVIVDGTPLRNLSLQDLDPLDILSIDIIKPDEARALWGTAGYNGAIIIKTKKHKPIRVIVRDAGNGTVIADASVHKVDPSFSARTGKNGEALIGGHKRGDGTILEISGNGYRPLRIQADGDTLMALLERANDDVGVVYPNPVAKGQMLAVRVSIPFQGQICLSNSSGQIVKFQSLMTTASSVTEFSTGELTSGMYFIKGVDRVKGQLFAKKLVIQ